MQKVILMVVHTPGEREVRASCETCRWAEVVEPTGLRCRKMSRFGGRVLDVDSIAVAVPLLRECDVDLAVAPTFGCVQWEGKE